MSFDEKELCEDFFEHIDDLLEFPVDDDLDALVRDDQAVNVAGIESWSSNGGLLFDSPTAADDVIVMNTTTCPAANNFDQSCSEQQPATDGVRHHQNHLQHSQVLSVIPCEDMAELEWLSNFVEDSFSNSPTKEINPIDPFSSANVSSHGITTTITTVAFKESHQFRSSSPVSVLESSSSGGGGETASKNSRMLSCVDDNSNQQFISTGNTIPGRARSKRPRPTAAYSPRYHLLPYPTATTSTAIAASSETESSNNVPTISLPDLSASSSCFTAQLEYVHTEYNVPPKKILCKGIGLFGERKRKKAFEHSVSVRKCTHCEIQKTPQWRAGPLGPKTLCNACGVRFKSGRLYPEYRPAASPTFVPSKHSNSHKKVLEMRVRKMPAEEDEEQKEEELLLQGNPLMASFTESEYGYYYKWAIQLPYKLGFWKS